MNKTLLIGNRECSLLDRKNWINFLDEYKYIMELLICWIFLIHKINISTSWKDVIPFGGLVNIWSGFLSPVKHHKLINDLFVMFLATEMACNLRDRNLCTIMSSSTY